MNTWFGPDAPDLLLTVAIIGGIVVWLMWDDIRPKLVFIMSRFSRTLTADQPVDQQGGQQATGAEQPIATTDNEGNSELPVNAVVPEEARDIIRFQAKVEALAVLIRDGQVTNMAKGIEKTFGCSRSSKESSTYQQALRALQPLIKEQPRFPNLTPEQLAARQALGLQD